MAELAVVYTRSICVSKQLRQLQTKAESVTCGIAILTVDPQLERSVNGDIVGTVDQQQAYFKVAIKLVNPIIRILEASLHNCREHNRT